MTTPDLQVGDLVRVLPSADEPELHAFDGLLAQVVSGPAATNYGLDAYELRFQHGTYGPFYGDEIQLALTDQERLALPLGH